ncbi:hypothetical protein N0V90_006697 [Kalmusia sp. IMI 367209]|nr:hypothetical protein N0V90_006697 [Kalmusia sp. IMI 367209]
MPRYLQPKVFTQHRVAEAIALYRALLSRCSSAPLLDNTRVLLHNAIRAKFRQNRKLQSPYQLGLVFRAGYEVLDLLDSPATGNAKSVDILKSLIPSLPRRITRTPSLRQPPTSPSRPSMKHPLAALPPEKAVLNVRPFAKTSGPRHVPILASANGVPFLRIKKPQPPALSRILRQKLERRINRFHLKVLLTNYWIPMSNYEDEWDIILGKECGIVDNDGAAKELPWVYEMVKAERANTTAFEKDMATDRDIATRMVALVDKETELAVLEGQKIQRGRKSRPIRSRWLK